MLYRSKSAVLHVRVRSRFYVSRIAIGNLSSAYANNGSQSKSDNSSTGPKNGVPSPADNQATTSVRGKLISGYSELQQIRENTEEGNAVAEDTEKVEPVINGREPCYDSSLRGGITSSKGFVPSVIVEPSAMHLRHAMRNPSVETTTEQHPEDAPQEHRLAEVGARGDSYNLSGDGAAVVNSSSNSTEPSTAFRQKSSHLDDRTSYKSPSWIRSEPEETDGMSTHLDGSQVITCTVLSPASAKSFAPDTPVKLDPNCSFAIGNAVDKPFGFTGDKENSNDAKFDLTSDIEGPIYSNLLYVPCRDSPPPPPLPLSPPPMKVPPLPPTRNATTVLTSCPSNKESECSSESLESGCERRWSLPEAPWLLPRQEDRCRKPPKIVDKDYVIYESRRCTDTGATIVTISSGNDYDPTDHVYASLTSESVYEEIPNSISTGKRIKGSNPFGRHRRSFFEGASKAEILKYLEGAKDRVVHQIAEEECENLLLEEEEDEISQPKDRRIENSRNNPIRISNISSSSESSTLSSSSSCDSNADDGKKSARPTGSAEVERADSGVGTETSRPHRQRKVGQRNDDELLCADCDQQMESPVNDDSPDACCPLVCAKCDKKKSERKEILTEIVETEFKYGKDLLIIKEEFYTPMEVAALLSKEQLNSIFLNLNELIRVNRQFAEKLKDAVDIAVEQGDEDYTTVNIGKLFLGTSSMLQAFEVYCIQQGSASVLLSNLEKEKELLRIFLRVSQMENNLLRRMNLSAFLMVPVQRVTKYPLLLNRLYKVTPYHHQDREALREAQLKIELHLDHINQQTKGVTGTKIWRRLSNISAPHRRTVNVTDIGSIQFRKVAMEILQWSKEEIRFVMAGKLSFSAAADLTKSRRGKAFKFTPSHALLATLGKPNSNYRPDLIHDGSILFPRDTGIRDATLLLMKEKYGKYSLAREPLHLGNCVISSELEEDDIIEIQEYTTKESVYLKAECRTDAMDWLKQLRYHAKDLGTWRRRRNALANIMINGTVRQ